MQVSYAPIAFFAFNRPGHTERTLAALAANPEAAWTDVHIFVDGPRSEADAALVAQVESVARSARGFRSVQTEASDHNLGLYASITRGVGRMVEEAGCVIVVEDDILVSPHFLRYMNDALERFASESRVGSIHAYAPPIPNLPEFYFLRGGDCWGWATWADRWALLECDPRVLLRRIVGGGHLNAFSATHGVGSLLLLLARARGKNQSWAILWHASLFLAGRLTLHPGKSFVQNIGNDGSGEHAAATDVYSTELVSSYDGLPSKLPLAENVHAGRALSSFLDSTAAGPKRSIRRRLTFLYAHLAARIGYWFA